MFNKVDHGKIVDGKYVMPEHHVQPTSEEIYFYHEMLAGLRSQNTMNDLRKFWQDNFAEIVKLERCPHLGNHLRAAKDLRKVQLDPDALEEMTRQQAHHAKQKASEEGKTPRLL